MVADVHFRRFFVLVSQALEGLAHSGDWRINLVETGSG